MFSPATSILRRKRICIVTNAPISQNPRVVKEADALSAAGHDVTVLFAQHVEWSRPFDQTIMAKAAWRAHAVEVWPGGWRRAFLRNVVGARAWFFRVLARVSTRAPIAELAYSRYFVEQLWLAYRVRADLYIGHNPPSLPVVAWAAKLRSARYGFDFEDFHQGQAAASEAGSLPNRLLAILEARYVPKADHLTAASRGIAEEVAKLHDIAAPPTILNVFNWGDRVQLACKPSDARRREHLSLYWYSQIVSLDRGLQDVIRAIGKVREPVTLAIRGDVTAEAKSELLALARACGVEERITFLPVIHPDELLAAAADYDIGLCLEVPSTLNRDICITNKIFFYMLAGLAVVASRTRGHEDVFKLRPGVGFLYPSGDAAALAGVLDRLAQDGELLAGTKAQALAAARERWNWEQESRLLVSAIDALA